MKKIFVAFVFLTFCLANFAQQNTARKHAIVIHGGAGTILKSSMTPQKEKAYKAALELALKTGDSILQNGGKAIDAVVATIKILEDCPLFNAGKGAVFTNEGKNELDASIMDGSNLKAGSVAGVTTIKNPITAALAVMQKSEHVMMAGKGAEKFAKENGCTVVSPNYFFTKERWESLQKAKQQDAQKMDSSNAIKDPLNKDYKYGTVGCAALDIYGNIASGTSTGGMTNKKYGRIGDAPIIGSGTYADNNTCAISCTGWGEFFIRLSMAKAISDRMELKGMSLEEAAKELIHVKLPALGGDGGLIGIDKMGNITMQFCTPGMYRGFINKEGKMVIKIYKED
ncbi:MAG: isoaspartyl peptidase/L-asparaginase family protein [Chitinophagaceae bacterium]